MVACIVCNTEFRPTNRYRPQTTCSKKCRYERVRQLRRDKSTHEKTCPICGKAWRQPNSHSGVKTCSIECGAKYRSKKADRECEQCGKPHLMSEGQKYCSLKCVGAAKRLRAKNERVTAACKNCGSRFEQCKPKPRKYCSRECANTARRITRVKTACKTCGKKFEQYENSNQKYCCRRCFHTAAKSTSGLESKFAALLDELGIEYKRDFRIQYDSTNPLKAKRYDFLITGTNVLIEVDGDYWHANPKYFGDGKRPLRSAQKKAVANDTIKNDLASEHGYVLKRFWESDVHGHDFKYTLLEHLNGRF